MSQPGAIGYYRYTDIVFEWHKCLDPLVASPLRTFLSAASLIHPDNPLNSGSEGIEMTMGTLINSESRLLFSSAQIEYIRYWLKAMGLTEELIPLPNSSYLITTEQLRVKTPVVYKTINDIKKALKDITKLNKRVKDVDPDLVDLRVVFEKARTHYTKKNGIWCAMDFEGLEGFHTYVTEFGYSLIKWEGETEKVETEHWIVKNAPRNGQYVADNRDYFKFGKDKSQVIPKPDLPGRIKELVQQLSEQGPLYLVFHDYRSDLKYLKQMGVDTDAVNILVPEAIPSSGIFCIDTLKLFCALEGDSQPKSLERVVRLLGIKQAERFHNAGNDAYYTLAAMRSMLEGPQLDVQREARWPPAPVVEGLPTPKRSLKRQTLPGEDESDFWDETEDVL